MKTDTLLLADKKPVHLFNEAALLVIQVKALGLPPPVFEHRFHATRKWRFDFAWPKRRVAVEIDGEGFRSRVTGEWIPGRHIRTAGFRRDLEKMNAAAELGWKVYRYTPAMVREGIAAHQLERVLKKATR